MMSIPGQKGQTRWHVVRFGAWSYPKKGKKDGHDPQMGARALVPAQRTIVGVSFKLRACQRAAIGLFEAAQRYPRSRHDVRHMADGHGYSFAPAIQGPSLS